MHWGLTVGPLWLLDVITKRKRERRGESRSHPLANASLKVGIPEAAAA